jgi:hypothetical protein
MVTNFLHYWHLSIDGCVPGGTGAPLHHKVRPNKRVWRASIWLPCTVELFNFFSKKFKFKDSKNSKKNTGM